MKRILEGNRRWVKDQLAKDPQYFEKLALGQKPRYLFIGCSDSRVPGSGITGTGPGEMFTHRNIANLVVHTDMNLLSVLQYAVEVLEVEVIMVVGHYGCGGVAAAASNNQYGLIDNWLTNIRDVIRLHETELLRIKDDEERLRRLVELNVIEQVRNLAKTTIIQNARKRQNPPKLHGLVYDIREGILKDLEVSTEDLNEFQHIYQRDKAVLTAGTQVLLEKLQQEDNDYQAPAAQQQEEQPQPLAADASQEEPAELALNSNGKQTGRRA
ncbi:carbonate dehydratase [Hymenobacter sp. 15J16-1T3B]|uniref:carbonate dehydratase n=1 Tax=Hymenobacter sp. 15J16-1T3B TaxID=2886941 RepID=UPI001D11FA63|nr:carbonate dehydratase [Hymenobacter sp. 15J16-1T3B]MCC3158518.1 carbonate dehydratase [Hymenobacter sp. 15J16-1T3B]